MRELMREKGESNFPASGHVRDTYYAKESRRSNEHQVDELGAMVAHLEENVRQLRKQQREMLENQARASSTHSLEHRIQLMEQAANARAYLKRPRPQNPPYNPDFSPNAPNFIIYGSGLIEVLRDDGQPQQDPVFGSPIQARVAMADMRQGL